ncbi:sulfate ABC transporter permease subunit CysT [Alicyclobacillus acidoterrestris]|uniref:sulfate ABC transporter permease subunit CysT n=1 Tax=Alicyclobacillus acidoterrestris TaxID=1450 RepID=UPI0011932E4D|nr:sulfate transporter CysT [Alicyclobacillus acidoterrestris]
MIRQIRARLAFTTISGYLLLLIVLPVGAIFTQAFSHGIGDFLSAITQPIGLAALGLTVRMALITAVINGITGTIVAFVIVRFRLPGRQLLNAIVDLPFAIPTTVSGLMLIFLYGPTSPLGTWLAAHGVKIIYSPFAILLAMVIVTFPYTIRSVQPLLEELDPRMEEAAWTLGAQQTRVFRSILLPVMWPGITTGCSLCFSRALSEFGAVVMVAGNIPMHTQVSAYYLYGLLENYDSQGAASVSVVLLAISFFALLYQLFATRRFTRNQSKRVRLGELELGR